MLNVRKIWENSNIAQDWPDLASSVRFDEPMAAHTTFRVGGPADLFVCPGSEDSLAALVNFFFGREIPVSLVGGGSNLLVADRGIRGAVISLEGLNSINTRNLEDAGSGSGSAPAPGGASAVERAIPGALRATGSEKPASSVIVIAGAGASMKALTEWCAEQGITGMERFAGLPGSVGGAAFMNARCYDRSVSDVFFEGQVLYFDRSGYTLLTVPYREGEWDYKESPFQHKASADPIGLVPGDGVLSAVSFALSRGDRSAIEGEMERFIADRKGKGHYRYPSAGSMFKNNRAFGKPSGVLIDETGLKGFRIGDAQVSPWHGNIVINAGNATAADLRLLVEEVRRRVFERTGFELESEVIMAGDW